MDSKNYAEISADSHFKASVGVGSESLNIPLGLSSVSYELLYDAIALLQLLGKLALVAKVDIEVAF